MRREGPIILVDDDRDEWFLLKTALSQLDIKNKMMFFQNGSEAFDYINNANDHPFLILCDVNIPIVKGPELMRRLRDHKDIRKRSIPFIFFCSEVSGKTICPHNPSVQGFFIRPNTFDEIKAQLEIIISYWKNCREPIIIQ